MKIYYLLTRLTLFEIFYLLISPFVLPLHRTVQKKLRRIVDNNSESKSLVDIGGRKSHYTIGIPAVITITDIKRETLKQNKLNLGINDSIIDQTIRRRSNIHKIIYDDMTKTNLVLGKYDYAISVEVIEHVNEDDAFVKNISKVLSDRGILIITTPNGDYLKKPNIGHVRHYKKIELEQLLLKYFDEVEVEYAIKSGVFRKYGLKSWSIKNPFKTITIMLSNLINYFQSINPKIKNQPYGTHHLIAVAKKKQS